jgi:hypothetical protein
MILCDTPVLCSGGVDMACLTARIVRWKTFYRMELKAKTGLLFVEQDYPFQVRSNADRSKK